MRHFLKALRIMAVVSEWSVKSLEDGKVTIIEALDLVMQICTILGVKTEFEIPED